MVERISDANNVPEVRSTQASPPAAPSARDQEDGAVPGDKRVQQLQAAVERLIRRGMPADSKLEIEYDSTLETFIYRSVDPETGAVVRQWPPPEFLDLRRALKEMAGMLIDKKA